MKLLSKKNTRLHYLINFQMKKSERFVTALRQANHEVDTEGSELIEKVIESHG